MSFFISVAFVINAKSRYFTHFACFVIAHCRTFVLPASRFLACVHFRSSYQRVDFIDTLRPQKLVLRSVFILIYIQNYSICSGILAASALLVYSSLLVTSHIHFIYSGTGGQSCTVSSSISRYACLSQNGKTSISSI